MYMERNKLSIGTCCWSIWGRYGRAVWSVGVSDVADKDEVGNDDVKIIDNG